MAACIRAGQYTVSYSSSGYLTVSPVGYSSYQVPYAALTGGGYGAAAPSAPLTVPPNPPGTPGPGEVASTGSITANFTWSGGGTPPSSVVVKEVGSAAFRGWNNGKVATGCSDGFDQTWTSSQYGGSASCTKYTVVDNPGSSFSMPACTPEADGYLPPPAPPGWPTGAQGGAMASVSYAATAYDLDIVFGGAQNFGGTDWRILVGRQLDATVDRGGLPGGQGDSYSWNAGDASAFNFWFGSHSAGQFSLPFSTDQASLVCYYGKPDGRVTVGCNFTVACAGNEVAHIRKVLYLAGPVSTLLQPEVGTVQKRQDPTYGLCMELWGADPLVPGGTLITGAVSSPAGYPGSTSSYWNFVQLAYPERSGYEDLIEYDFPLNGDWGLDTTLSDDYVFPAGEFDVNTPPRCWVADIAVNHSVGDSPLQALAHPPLDDCAVLDEQMQDYMMYCPPGANSVYVPLWIVNWSWSGISDYDPDTSTWCRPYAAGATIDDGTAYPDPPFWTYWIDWTTRWMPKN